MADNPSEYPRRWQVLPIVLTASFMALFDSYVMSLASPTIQSSLHASVPDISLAVAAYLFAFAAGQVIGGRLGDRWGHRLVFTAGMAAFAVTSAVCAVAADPAELVAARFAQGAAGAAMVPQVLALIASLFPDHGERSRAIAWYAVAVGAGGVCGQTAGGALLAADPLGLGWRTLFLINVPIGLGTALAARRFLPAPGPPVRATPIDITGALGVSAAIGLLVVPLALGGQEHWPAGLIAALALSPVAFAAAMAQQWRRLRRGADPFLAVDLLGRRSFRAGMVFIAAFMAFFGAFTLGVAEYLQEGDGFSPLRAGLVFAPLGAAYGVTSLTASGFARRRARLAITTGVAVTAAAVIALLAVILASRTQPPLAALIALLGAVGAGNGLAVPALYGPALADLPAGRVGAGSGMLNTAQQFANAIGIGLLGTIFATAAPHSSIYRHDLTELLIIDLVLLAIALAASRLFPGGPAAPWQPPDLPADAAVRSRFRPVSTDRSSSSKGRSFLIAAAGAASLRQGRAGGRPREGLCARSSVKCGQAGRA